MLLLNAKFLRTAITFAFSFGLGKGAAFCAALALPRLMDARSYGGIELALTIGMLGTTVLGMGAPSVAMKFALVDKDPRAEAILAVHLLWLAGIGAVAAPLAAALGQPAEYVCGIALFGLFGFQMSASAYTRMKGHIHLSGWLDNTTMMFVFVVVAGMALFETVEVATFAWCFLILGVALACAASRPVLRLPVAKLQTLFREVVNIGLPMMFFGLTQMLMFGTARLAIGAELGLTDVASFSLCARVALVLVFTSQILNVGLFRSVYQMEPRTMGRVFAIWTAALAALGVLVALAGHFGGGLLVAGTDISSRAFVATFPLVVVQTNLWILNSNLEMFVVRELLSRQAAVACLSVVGLGLVAGLVLSAWGWVSLPILIWLYSVAMVVMLLLQMRLLSRKGVNFRSAYIALPLIGAPWLVTLLPAYA